MLKTSKKRMSRGKMVPSTVLAMSLALSACDEGFKNADGSPDTKIGPRFFFSFTTGAAVLLSSKSNEPAKPAADTFAARHTAMGDTYTRTRYRYGSGIPSPGANAAASGTAVYEGNAGIRTVNLAATNDAIGKARIEADFTQNTISGQIDRFLDPSDAPVNGSMTLANGKITRADRPNYPYQDDSVSADLSGNLDVSGSNTTVTGTLSGIFREGQVPEPISPSGPGYITGNINLTTGGSLPLYGNFTFTRK